MRITKFPQSNFLIEEAESKILIDPGFLTFEKYTPNIFGKLKAVLITHQHADHLEVEALKYWQREHVPIFGNDDVAHTLAAKKIKVKKVGIDNELSIGSFKIRTIDIAHCRLLFCSGCRQTIIADSISLDKKCALHPNLQPQTVEGPPNTGYLINGTFFHPGDGISLSGLKVPNAAIPITGPTIDYSAAWTLAEALGAKIVIPMHYSHPKFPASPVEFSKMNKSKAVVVIASDGEYVNL
ncbi:MAG: hypothetical protein A2864_00850 [Candidatus Woykebacteria bacterium RIFCSPHIGHO2_01_FULL_39_12]|uniref:Metallo-beta-lactamase domain-containing protein n=1 Tax=Candidatus Woykebacteria bacterium RIFCSPHIGHO2_01_FULL_39_12 TaxID=1802599 RepID=A0A1G1WJ55_9BACT|nr:MAG: hypothetical protein A2864_00850 [Candidatus Woykebacteria bacterium RIFCSPHIGHO2_01_FULL_39_12]